MLQKFWEILPLIIALALMGVVVLSLFRLGLRVSRPCPECGDTRQWYRRYREIRDLKSSSSSRKWVRSCLLCPFGHMIATRKKIFKTWLAYYKKTQFRMLVTLIREKYNI